jgi:hypothetical protein
MLLFECQNYTINLDNVKYYYYEDGHTIIHFGTCLVDISGDIRHEIKAYIGYANKTE